jgi:hypothetical protein
MITERFNMPVSVADCSARYKIIIKNRNFYRKERIFFINFIRYKASLIASYQMALRHNKSWESQCKSRMCLGTPITYIQMSYGKTPVGGGGGALASH